MRVLWICGLPEEVRKAHPVTDVKSAAWSWIVGHLPPPSDIELHILCPVFGLKDVTAHFEHGGAHWHCYRLKRFEPLFLRRRFYWSVRKFVENLNPDAVHGWGGESGCGLLATYCSPRAVVGVQGLLKMLVENARRWNVKIPETGSMSAWFRGKLESLAYRRAHRLVVESMAAHDTLWAHYGLRAEVVPHPLRREFLADLSGERMGGEGSCRFLFVGQMTYRKGAMDAVRAFDGLGDVDARLTMVGTGELDGQIGGFIGSRGLQGRVVRIPECSAEDLKRMMDVSDAILLPSYGDTGPTVLKEALARGLYSIVYDNTGARELVLRYGCGTVVNTGDVMLLRDAMMDVVSGRLQSPEGCGVISAGRIRDDLSPGRIWEDLKRIYRT